MLVAAAAKIVAVAALALVAGVVALGHLASLGGTPSTADAGAFGGKVTAVGSIEWDLGKQTSRGLQKVRCAQQAQAGTSCYVAAGR